MQEKLNTIRSKRKIVLFFFVFAIGLAGVTPVLADYLGPNRTITETTSVCKVNLYECKYVASKDDYRYKITDSWSCSNESKPWKAYSSDPSPWGCSAMTDGDTYWSQDEIIQEVTNTYPPATIKGVLQNCTLSNGWCSTAPQLALSGTEPVAGYKITAIEGTLNGKTFACSSASCAIPLIEGNNNFTYWALSSWGDSSTMGTLTAKVDSKQPTITGTLTGVSGSNGWYVSPVSFAGSASDTTSGLASFTCVLDGLTLASCSSIDITAEGAHSLVLTARDKAGNTRTSTSNASIDTQNPNLDVSFAGTLGSNNWFTSAVLNGTASDPVPGSGVSAFEYNLDGSGWSPFPASGVLDLPEGQHTVDVQAADYSGHVVSSSKSLSLDSVLPDVVVDASGTLGSNNWYITNPSVSASATDATSGLDVFEYSLDNSSWTTYTSAVALDEGAYTISFWVQDRAGLVRQVDRTYQVDTRLPQIAGSISGVTGLDGWYTSDVTLSASASDPAPGSGLDAFTYILDDSAPTSYSVPLNFTDGQHEVQLTAQDQAGLSYSIQQTIKVDTQRPSLSVSTTLPAWIKGNVTLSGTAADTGSGLSKVEISTDDGNTWQALPEVDSWNFNWSTQNSPDGSYKVHIRATDKAGLTTEQILNVGLDNHAPSISLPDSWLQWNSVTLDIWDDYSGLSDARVEIIDPQGHWHTRIIELDPKQFPLTFRWDRRWADGTTAPSGEYQVQVTAVDNLGQVAKQSASVEIVLDILPAGPTATPQTYVRPQPTVTPSYTATPLLVPTATPTAVISAFGAIAPTVQAIATPTVVVTPRATPTQTTILSWLESFFAPNPDSTSQTTELISMDESHSANARNMGSQSNILWGAAAAAAVGAATAYAAEERRRQQAAVEAEQQAQRQKHEAKLEQDAIKAAEKEQRHSTITQHMAKLEAQRLQEEAWEQARLKQKTPDITYDDVMEAKMAGMDWQQDTAWMASQQIIHQRNEEKKKAEELKAGLAAYYSATKQGNTLTEQPAEKSWWQQYVVEPAKKVLNPKTITGAVLTVALGSTAVMARNLVENPHVFDDAFVNAQTEWRHTLELHPDVPTDQKTRFQYLFSHPYEAFSTGYDRIKAAANIVAGYADAAWQQNPMSQVISNGLKQIGDNCPQGIGEAWSRRCSAVFYFGSSLVEHPADTITNVGTALIADPVAGAIKTGAFLLNQQNPVHTVSDMYHAIKENGLIDGVKEFYKERFAQLKDFVADPQVKAFGMLALFGTLALLPALVIPTAILGSVFVGAQTITTVSQIDKLLQSAKTQSEAMQYASNKNIRRSLSINLVLLALATFGMTRAVKEVGQFQALQESLTPEAQASLANLSIHEQARLAELAARMELSPDALDFYLTESARLNSPLKDLSMADGLELSRLESAPETSAVKYIYDVKAGQYRDIATGRFVSPRNLPWPSDNGFTDKPIDTFLPEGTLIDRYGKLSGQFAGKPGTSISARGMAIGSENMSHTTLKVIKPLVVPGGTAAPVPEFGAAGGGAQYYFKGGLQWWIDQGYLEVIP